MPINYEQLMALKNLGQKYAYTDREVMLYAYGIGMGADPMDENELAYVNEGTLTPRPLRVVPTFASVAAWGAGPGEMNLNRVMVVDGERDITFHRPLPGAAKITADSTVLDVFDKGKDKGAVIRHQTVLKDENGEKLATLVASRFARGDGGFGGPSEGQPEPHKVPGRAPDKIVDITTRPDQALVYRLCGDRNPLHSDPAFARKAGFGQPILHGLCTYGVTGRALLEALCDDGPDRFGGMSGRFASPVLPAGNSKGSRFGWFAMLSQATIVTAMTASIRTGCRLTRKPRRSPRRRAVRGSRAPPRRRNAGRTLRPTEKTGPATRVRNRALRTPDGRGAASGWRRARRETPPRSRRAASPRSSTP